MASAVTGGGTDPGGTDPGGTDPARTAVVAVGGAARNLLGTARAAAVDTVTAVAGVVEMVGGATGAPRAPAVLRVQVLILADEWGRPLCPPDAVRPAVAKADTVFRTEAGIRVRLAGVRTLTEPAPTRALDPHANRRLLLDDVLGHTAVYRRNLPAAALAGGPVTVVVVRSIAGRTTGCSLGMSADWVICQAALFDRTRPDSYDETVLAHELGHALNLPHHRDRSNLMYPTSSPPGDVRGTGLRRWQGAVLRANRHTIPGLPRSPQP